MFFLFENKENDSKICELCNKFLEEKNSKKI